MAQLVSVQPSVYELPSLIPGDISPFCVALTSFKCPKNRALIERGV